MRTPVPRDHPLTRRRKRPKTKPTAPGSYARAASGLTRLLLPSPLLPQLPGALAPCGGSSLAITLLNLFLICKMGES